MIAEIIARMDLLQEDATPGPFEYRICDDLNNSMQVPCVIGAGLVGRSCIARFADDHEGHADAELYALFRNTWKELSTELKRRNIETATSPESSGTPPTSIEAK